jgi:protein-disulfide isomerase
MKIKGAWAKHSILDLAEKLKLSTAALHQALETANARSHVRADFKGGAGSGVNGTPTFFINGHRHGGCFDFETVVSAIHQAMGTAKSA